VQLESSLSHLHEHVPASKIGVAGVVSLQFLDATVVSFPAATNLSH
jgi:hypothetical protein